MTTPWCYHFERFIGRRLSRADRAVIAPLEQARLHRDARPVVVIDPPGHDSSHILLHYLRYRQAASQLPSLLIAPTRHCHAFRQSLPRDIRVGSPRNVDHHRGQTFFGVLLLDVHEFKTRSPFFRSRGGDGGIGRDWNRLLSTLLPTFTSWGFFIIHLRDKPRRRSLSAIPDTIPRLIAVPPPHEHPSQPPIGCPGSLSGLLTATPTQQPPQTDLPLVHYLDFRRRQ